MAVTEETTAAPQAEGAPDYIRLAAKAAPGQWIGLVDPTWQGEGTPPAWALVGEWRGDEDGELAEFRENEEYRPSPLAREWPEPTDPIDRAVQLSATGYGPPEDVHRALAAGPLAVALDEDGRIEVVELPDGAGPAVLAFSSDAQVSAAGDPVHAETDARELVELLPESHWILLNLGGAAAMRISPADIRAHLADEPEALEPEPVEPVELAEPAETAEPEAVESIAVALEVIEAPTARPTVASSRL